ncbi:MAG: glycosyltransferase [Candidatus Komeilibacteria bacterium]|nr:glycosyltransferase [Candidatus Komeilibacteria bacterium]
MTVCFFGIYLPDYCRNKVLMDGLRQNGVNIIECNSRARGLKKYFELIRLHRRIKNQYDVLLVAFPGYQSMLLAKLLTNKPIIFDAFNSIYDSTVLDRKLVGPKSLGALYYWLLNWLACKLANKILLDTNDHIDYFVSQFKLKRAKFYRVFISADEQTFFPVKSDHQNEVFTVHFHGSFIALQGIEYILQAANILRDQPIKFNIIGKGQLYPAMRELADELKLTNVNFTGYQQQAEISRSASQADICLGVFGKTEKASRVIPIKVYESLAMAKPIITGESMAAKELMTNEENILFCQMNSAQDLADKIVWLKNDPALRQKISANGYQLYQNKLRPVILGRELIAIINK